MDRMDENRTDAELRADKGAKTNDIIHHDDHPGVGDHVGEAAGGISGVLAGAAIGSVGGPIGTVIGGIAGAIGGWWSGRAISEAATKFTHSDDAFYRSHYESSPNRLADRSYEDVRPAYQLGHIASANPDYADREFDAVESDLQQGWSGDLRSKHGEWDSVRGYARDAFQRGRSTGSSGLGASATAANDSMNYGAAGVAGSAAGMAGGLADRTADKLDDLKDRVDGNPASKPGVDSTDSARRAGGAGGSGAMGGSTETGAERLADRAGDAAHKVGDKAENLWDRTKSGAEHLGHKVADKADDLKDRVDGNPASRPGPDSTDAGRRF